MKNIIPVKINFEARNELVNKGVIMIDTEEISRMRSVDKLDNIVGYYSDVIEALGGDLIWDILDARKAAMDRIEEKRTKARSNDNLSSYMKRNA